MTCLTENEKETYANEGYLVLRGFYSTEETERLKRRLQEILEERSEKESGTEGRRAAYACRPIQEYHRHDSVIRNFAAGPRQFDLAREILGEEALLVGTVGFYKPPGSPALPMHQDNFDIGPLGGRSCGIWTSLDNSDPLNGGLCIAPGSHRMGLYSKLNRNEALAKLLTVELNDAAETAVSLRSVQTDPGDVVIFDGNTVHGSYANNSKNRYRHAFASHFIGTSTEKVLAHFDQLINRDGEIVRKPVNKSAMKIRL